MPKRKHNQQWYKEQLAVAAYLERLGYRTRQQPGSGNKDITLQNDVVWHDSPIGHLEIECKWREKSLWKSLLKWMGGADILTLKCHENRKDQDGRRYAVLRWDTFMALVGDAAQRAEAADLGAQIATPDKPWLTEHLGGGFLGAGIESVMQEEQERREAIQNFHQNPPKRPMKPRRLGK